jgi:hypothetical protein
MFHQRVGPRKLGLAGAISLLDGAESLRWCNHDFDGWLQMLRGVKVCKFRNLEILVGGRADGSGNVDCAPQTSISEIQGSPNIV